MSKFKKSAVHNLSHAVKFSGYMGNLIPIACFDAVPGDKINHKVHALIRTQPLLAPLMHEVDVDVHAYFVPDRLVFDGSEDFQSGGEDGQDTTVRPYMNAPASTGYAVGSLADYYGLPVGVPDFEHDARPIRGYNLIYNLNYRDSQLQTPVDISIADGSGGEDTTTSRDLQRVCWKRDYFTKARPEPQLGDEVVIPLAGNAPVTGIGTYADTYSNVNDILFETESGESATKPTLTAGSGAVGIEMSGPSGGPDNLPEIYADMSSLLGIPISELREANAVQRWQEHNNLFGGRYMEQLMARFGVLPQDARLQWPEFLGAGHTKIQFSEVLQTAEGTDPVGEMRGHGISIVGSNRYRYHVKEHGFIHVFMILRPKTQYMQGLHRMWSRKNRFDYLLPEFTAIGDQAILNKEIDAEHASPDEIWGYTPYGEDYRTIPSRVAGDMRDTLDYYHMARKFTTPPSLNGDFVKCTPTTRIYPATNEPQIYVNTKHTIQARRLLNKTPQYALK